MTKLMGMTAGELIQKQIEPRKQFLPPIVYEKCLSLIFAPPGWGKSYFCLWLAGALAGKGEFLKWSSANPARVCYIDAEMGEEVCQTRLVQLAKSAGYDIPEDGIRFVTMDAQPDLACPAISEPGAQAEYEQFFTESKTEVVIFDNYCSLVYRKGNEPDEVTWGRVRQWFIKLRAKRIAVILIHHAGKSGSQLGTSTKEQVMDWIISLRKDPNSRCSGVSFWVDYTKPIRTKGNCSESFWVNFAPGIDDTIEWSWKSAEERLEERTKEMKEVGCSDTNICEGLGITKEHLKRILRSMNQLPEEEDLF